MDDPWNSYFFNKWSPFMSHFKEELSHFPVWAKFYDVPLVSYTSDGLSLMATKIGTPMMLDSYTNSMCLESLGQSSYTRILIEINACNDINDHLVIHGPVIEADDEGSIELKKKKSGGNNDGIKNFTFFIKPKTPYRSKAIKSHQAIKDGVNVVKVRPYHYPVSQKAQIETMVADMLAQDHRLYAKLSKCVSGQERIEYLGHVVTGADVDMDPAKVTAVANWLVPTSVSQLRAFLGLTVEYKVGTSNGGADGLSRCFNFSLSIVHANIVEDIHNALATSSSISSIISQVEKVPVAMSNYEISLVAYKLELPATSRIHPVFHVSFLKPCVGEPSDQYIPLPLLSSPEVQWDGRAEHTWESWNHLQQQYPNIALEDKVSFDGERNVILSQQNKRVKEQFVTHDGNNPSEKIEAVRKSDHVKEKKKLNIVSSSVNTNIADSSSMSNDDNVNANKEDISTLCSIPSGTPHDIKEMPTDNRSGVNAGTNSTSPSHNGSANKNGGEKVSNDHFNESPSSYASKLIPTSSTKTSLRKLEANVPNGVDYDIWLPLALVHEVNDRMKNSLYGYFIGKRLVFPGVESVLRNGPWMILGILIFLNKWSPSVSHFKEELSHVPVWAKFYDVPLVAYTSDGLSLMATKIGTPMMLDSYTNSMCLESLGQRNVYTKEIIRIKYEWEPLLCITCLIFGHSPVDCPKALKFAPTRVVNQKDNGKGRSSGADDEGSIELKKKKSGALNDENLIIMEVATGSMATTSDGKLVLVDDDGKPLKKVDYPVDLDSDDEVEPVKNKMVSFLALKSTGVGYGTKSLLEQ
ncbi:ribonuclease H-like domain-containing protein [Tanacetum coccineum]